MRWTGQAATEMFEVVYSPGVSTFHEVPPPCLMMTLEVSLVQFIPTGAIDSKQRSSWGLGSGERHWVWGTVQGLKGSFNLQNNFAEVGPDDWFKLHDSSTIH